MKIRNYKRLSLAIIYCTHCDRPHDIEIDYLKKGKFITCSNCQRSFNLFMAYEFLYNSVILAKKIVDTLFSAVSGKSQFTGNDDDLKIINHFCRISDFDSLLNDIVLDTILFGNSFIEKTNKEKGFIQRINPVSVEIVTAVRQIPPSIALHNVIDKLIQHTPVMREIDQSKFFHFLGGSVTEPFGDSVLGFWFKDWYRIVFNKTANMNWTKTTIIQSAGIPVHFIFPEMGVDSKGLSFFPSRIKRRRNQISRVIEREIIPMVLNKPFDRKVSPKLEIL